MLNAVMRIAIQGELGSFSHQAALEIVPKAVIQPCTLSADVFAALKSAKVDAAVVPIENSLAGSVTEHFDLLLSHDCHIVKEHSLRIVHSLIVIPGATTKDIRRVLSHPVALAQCRKFLQEQEKVVVESFYDTAGAVKYIMEKRSKDSAAIASALSARQYGAQILCSGIEDNRENHTRFFLIKKGPTSTARDANKVSLAFAVKNEAGTLFAALRAFADEKISLSKIESRPVAGNPWQYVFYVDLLTGNNKPLQRSLRTLSKQTDFVKLLGIYVSAK